MGLAQAYCGELERRSLVRAFLTAVRAAGLLLIHYSRSAMISRSLTLRAFNQQWTAGVEILW